MSNFIDSFYNTEEELEKQLMMMAPGKIDPVSQLDLAFAVQEKRLKRFKNYPKAVNLEQVAKIKRENYHLELKKKTAAAKALRVTKYNEFLSRWLWQRSYKREGDSYRLTDHWSQVISLITKGFYMQKRSDGTSYKRTVEGWSAPSNSPSYFTNLHKGSLPDFRSTHRGAWGSTWPGLLDSLSGASLFRNLSTPNQLHLWYLLDGAFPSVVDYEKNPDAHYFFIDFMENVPFPTPEQMDLAAKKACKYGSDEYADEADELLSLIHDHNIDPTTSHNYRFTPPKHDDYTFRDGVTTFGLPHINPQFDQMNYKARRDQIIADVERRGISRHSYIGQQLIASASYPSKAKAFFHKPITHYYWWPRPRAGYSYCAGLGFVNPFRFVPVDLHTVLTPYGYQKHMEARAARKRKRKQRGGFGGMLSDISHAASSGKPWEAVGLAVGYLMKESNPIYQMNRIMKQTPILSDVHREMGNLTGGLSDQISRVSDIPAKWVRGEPVTSQDLMEALDIGLKVVAIVAAIPSGGTSLALVSIGLGASQLQRGSWGKNELGRAILGLGEVVAVANVANTSIIKAAQKYAEKQALGALKQEVYKRSDLDETILGSFVVEATAAAGHRVYKGDSVVNAIAETGEKAAMTAVAMNDPNAAVLVAAFVEVRKHGIDAFIPNADSLSSPEEWFDNFDWGKIKQGAKELFKDKRSRKYIALGIMVSGGKIDKNTALGMVGQDIAMKQIDSFYDNKPVAPATMGEIEHQKAMAKMQQAKVENQLLSNVAYGYIPTPNEMLQIVDSATGKWIWDSITDIVPAGGQNDAWSIQMKIGFPDWAKIGVVEIPEWAKLGKIEMPPWAKTKLKEEHRQKINKEFEKMKQGLIDKLAWQNVLYFYLSQLWPPGVPLREVGTDNYNIIDNTGVLHVRQELTFPYAHPMIQEEVIPVRYTEEQIAYKEARKKELDHAVSWYKETYGEEPPDFDGYSGGMS